MPDQPFPAAPARRFCFGALLGRLTGHHPDAGLFAGLLFYVLCQFFGPDALYRWAALLIFLPTGLMALTRQRFRALRALTPSPLTGPLTIFLLYAAGNSLYFSLAHSVSAKPLLHCLCQGVFTFSVLLLFSRAPETARRRFSDCLILGTLLSGIASLVLFFFFDYQTDGRLIGIGHNHHSILGGLVFVQGGLMALGIFFKERRQHINQTPLRRATLIAAFIIVVPLTFFEQSKGVVLSLMLGVLALLLLFGYRKLSLAMLALVVAATLFAGGIFIHPIQPLVEFFRDMPYGEALYARAGSFRMEIWEFTAEMIKREPWLGYGLAAYFPYRFPHPHSLYLSAAYYLGAIGFVLFMAIVLRTLASIRKNSDADEKIFYVLFIACLLGGLTDLSEPVTGVSTLWFILWMPLAAYHGLRLRHEK